MPAQAHAGEVVADEDREFRVAGAGIDGRARDRADQGFARRQRFRGDQREFAVRVRDAGGRVIYSASLTLTGAWRDGGDEEDGRTSEL